MVWTSQCVPARQAALLDQPLNFDCSCLGCCVMVGQGTATPCTDARVPVHVQGGPLRPRQPHEADVGGQVPGRLLLCAARHAAAQVRALPLPNHQYLPFLLTIAMLLTLRGHSVHGARCSGLRGHWWVVATRQARIWARHGPPLPFGEGHEWHEAHGISHGAAAIQKTECGIVELQSAKGITLGPQIVKQAILALCSSAVPHPVFLRAAAT